MGMINRIAIDITNAITPLVYWVLIAEWRLQIGSIILAEYVLG
jgi:hypothetical protein